jgi:hypothetical protein
MEPDGCFHEKNVCVRFVLVNPEMRLYGVLGSVGDGGTWGAQCTSSLSGDVLVLGWKIS